MLRSNDVILLLVLVVTISLGITFPNLGIFFQPYLKYFMMSLLFLSFLSIELKDITEAIRHSWGRLLVLAGLKMIFLPIAIFLVFRAVAPTYALGALLLGGISTGVVAPFISNLVRANTPLVLSTVVATSFLAPFTLPMLVELLVGKSFDLPIGGMIRMLAQVIFIPMIAGEIIRRTVPRVVDSLRRHNFPLSLTLFGLINLGVFSQYSDYFRQQPDILLTSLVAAFLVAGLCLPAGLFILWRRPLIDQLAAAIIFGNINNILVIVFASQFFGPRETTIAAMYLLPFFAVIVPLRIFKRWREKSLIGAV